MKVLYLFFFTLQKCVPRTCFIDDDLEVVCVTYYVLGNANRRSW